MFNKNTLVVFGDSNVWGAELKDVPHRQPDFKSVVYSPDHLEEWPYHIQHSFSGIIAKHYNMSILNLAIPGCSNDTVFRRVNKFLQGNYPVNLDECFLMVFWTGVNRREFFRNDLDCFLNYCPTWPAKHQLFPTFHKEYSKKLLHNGYDLVKTNDYIHSVNALLSYNNIQFVQGYSLLDKDLANMVKSQNIPNFISYDENNAIAALPIIRGGSVNSKFNSYICTDRHPSETGHQHIADTYIKLLDKIYKS